MTRAGIELSWLLVPLLPLLAALPLVARRQQVGHWLVVAVVPALLLALWPQPVLFAPQLWPSASWGVEDALGRSWLGFTAMLWGAATLYAVRDQRNSPDERRFWAFWLLALCGNLLLIVARDGVSFYVGFTLMSLSAYGLVIHSGRPEARRAGLLYLQLAIFGEMLLLAGLAMRAHAAGIAEGNPLALDFAYWQGVPLDGLTLVLLLVGLGIKAGFWPLHIWLPQAHPVAPPAASAVLSGAMIKAGMLGLWRFLPAEDPLLGQWAPVLVIVGLTGALLAALQGLLAHRAKAVLAWSSVSQMGYLLMVLAAGWWWPESRALVATALMVYAMHHAFAKGALFLGAGMAMHYRLARFHWLLLAVPALSLAGAAMTSGALAKTGVKELYYGAAVPWLVPALGVGSVATTLLMLRFMECVHRTQRANPAERVAPPQLWLPFALLAAMPLIVPWVLPGWRAGMLTLLTPAALWSSVWPLLVAGLLAVCLWLMPARYVRAALGRFSVAGRIWIRLALLLRRGLVRVMTGERAVAVSVSGWRRLERRWNRWWARVPVVPATTALLGVLLLLGWWW